MPQAEIDPVNRFQTETGGHSWPPREQTSALRTLPLLRCPARRRISGRVGSRRGTYEKHETQRTGPRVFSSLRDEYLRFRRAFAQEPSGVFELGPRNVRGASGLKPHPTARFCGPPPARFLPHSGRSPPALICRWRLRERAEPAAHSILLGIVFCVLFRFFAFEG